MHEETQIAEYVPSSGRQRRKLAKKMRDRKCSWCREKAFVVRASGIACAICGRTLIDGSGATL